MSIRNETADKLNELLEKNYDAERGYANAAEATEHVELKRWLGEQGKRRTKFAAEISGEIKNLGIEPETDGSVKGDLHREWMNLKAALGDTEEAVLEECIRGEKASVEQYNEVLEEEKEHLAPTTTEILRRHRDEIKAMLNEVKSLEDIADRKNL